MKASILTSLFILSGVMFTAAAFANPATLPDHPGYPMGKLTDPVTGQSLANDTGRENAVGDEALNKAAAFTDNQLKMQQGMVNQNKKVSGPVSKAQESDRGSDIMTDQPMKGSRGQPSSK